MIGTYRVVREVRPSNTPLLRLLILLNFKSLKKERKCQISEKKKENIILEKENLKIWLYQSGIVIRNNIYKA